ncbi:klarsicht protein [Tribolium castaneum]|uniref:klarsicht protein n=1 Tax=Tribolium castaneum TaxID=7070 RepID=UPI0030FEDDCE
MKDDLAENIKLPNVKKATIAANMPVGTSFENSAMKTCFSLSSLPATDATPDKGVVKPRLYSSLTKNRVKATAVRRSWGSTASEHRDEFWSALQANYNYIMDNQLIDKCQEANSDLCMDTGTWSLKEFYAQFSELYLWLNSVQETIYGKEENIRDKALRAHCVNVVREKSSMLTLFNDQASQLVQLHPKVQEEVSWRVTHLNSKWDSILSILGPSECGLCEQEKCLDIDHEIKCLRKWFKMMEECLQPLNFRTKYTKTEIEAKALELKVLHRDIENHGKIVSSVVKLCKRPDASCNTVNVRRIANGLERRWHLLFLRSLEWQCYLETLSKKENCRNTSTSSDETDSDCYDEPVNKYPRLSSRDHSGIESRTSSENECGHNQEISNSSLIFQDVMNKNAATLFTPTSEDTVDGKCFRFGEDTSHFTRSNRKAPNLGTYYFKHEDTDSDLEKMEQHSVLSKPEVQSTVEETSEEEWTYTKNTDEAEVKSKPVPEETIRKLVQKAEELVSPDKCRKLDRINSINKMSRVKKWLSMEKPDDSCDASGEDDERESQISEDFDESTITCRHNSQNTSFTELNHSESTPKINLRQRKYTANRPWSVSCISQLDQTSSTKIIQNDITNFSISESALHKLAFTSKNLERADAVSANSIGVNGNNSTSSTVEETCNLQEKTSPNRRRRLKFKKKCGKIDLHTPYSPIGPKNRNLLIKSGSFSGSSNKFNFTERHTSSDPPAVDLYQGKYETSTTSGADSEEDLSKRIPSFKLGSKTHYLNSNLRNSSPGKSNTTEEQSSSLSEQAAWDSYQEKYLSEAYSETHDSDAARKLLEFGEDYRNFLDSQSDWSTNPDFSPTFRRRTLVPLSAPESDSDTESLRQLLNSSRDQLNYTKSIYKRQASLGINEYLVANEIDEMMSTCDRHFDLLTNVEKKSDELAISKIDKGIVAELLTQWTNLRNDVAKMQEYRNLQKDISFMKNLLLKMETFDSDCMFNLESVDDLPKEVDYCEKKLEDIYEHKKKLLALNVAVHRFVVENKEYGGSPLKTDISEMYRMWENLLTNTNERLAQLRPLLQQWKTLDNRLEQLQVDLRSDEKTLHLLDTALQGGVLSDQTASYVRDVAKLLSETTVVQGCKIPELFTEGGSLSDSGISDEGSEHEIGERERRLAAIRRLVRQLEVVLAPDCKARLKMAERLNAAEEELKALQKRCRSLIACTAAYSLPVRPCDEQREHEAAKDPDDDDPDEPATNSSWFRRVMRASVPFQVVIITLLCVACLLEPQCCDNMNNFAMSLSPQLRYIKGPPPI